VIRYLIALVLALGAVSQAQAQTAPDTNVLNICGGGPSGNYFWAAHQIAKFISPSLFGKVNVLTGGDRPGSLTNMRLGTEGKCQIWFAQSDVSSQFMIENPSAKDSIGVLAIVYTEYVQVLCPSASGWASLSDMAKAKGTRTMIVGNDGSGTAETWRIMRGIEPELYNTILRDPAPSDFASAHDVAKSTTTCMLWVSGLNSNDMVSTNDLSGRAKGGKPTLRLISVDDKRFLDIKGVDGKPLYTIKTIVPAPATGTNPALYDKLITNSGMFSSASIDVLTVPANMMIRLDYKEAIGRTKLTALLQAIDDAQPTIWAKVDPADSK
jgi:energy-coupling factor transporter ATP-binding protein EcfA2